MQTTTPLTLTKNEANILLHRLTVPDAIADCLLDTEGLTTATHSEIMNCAFDLQRQINHTQSLTIDTELQRIIIADAVDGSTYFANIEDEIALGNITHQWATALLRACDSLEAKLRAIGIESRNPRC